MSLAQSRQRSNLYNVTIVLLKFLLVPLAFYQLVLFVQLELKFGRPFDLVDATPDSQLSRDGSFYLAFYGVHILAPYQTVSVDVDVWGADQSAKLHAEGVKQKDVPFYPFDGDPLPGFALPRGWPPGIYRFRYRVTFHHWWTQETVSKGKTYSFRYDPGGVDVLVEGVPVFVRRGQMARLSSDWANMGLTVVGTNPGVRIEKHGQDTWIRAMPSLAKGEHTIQLQSLLYIDQVDLQQRRVATKRVGANEPGPMLQLAADTVILQRRTSPVGLAEAKPGYRIAFRGQPGGVRALLVTPASLVAAADVTLRFVVMDNEPPRSAYDGDDPGEVSVLTSYLFEGEYFNLSRYIVDPDGQNADNGNADIRVTRITLPENQPNYGLFTLPPARGGEDFLLHLTDSGRRALAAAKEGDEVRLSLEVSDEVNRPRLTLIITKNVLRLN
jgi:hypothetical protein